MKKGQCYISITEPELGIGIITTVNKDRFEIDFTERKVNRCYRIINPPLKRISFSVGDKINSHLHNNCVIKSVLEVDEIIQYITDKGDFFEYQITGSTLYNSPLSRLKSKISDSPQVFSLRYQANIIRCDNLSSAGVGFTGGRIDIIPHQIYIAHEISNRIFPRALLSDEVGLGKTIEALLIIHRLLQVKRINRILIIVPDPLLFQWYAELLHRFNLVFRMIDKTYIHSFTKNDENPFLDSSQCLTGISFLKAGTKAARAVLSADWDMIVVDEAHKIHEASDEYSVLEKLISQCKRVLLLTATPEQLGLSGHFSRLKLLDPVRYTDFQSFQIENQNYKMIADSTRDILSNNKIKIDSTNPFLQDIQTAFNNKKLTTTEKFELIRQQVDRYGISRVMFRNTRKIVKGFPLRKAFEVKIPENNVEEIRREFLFEYMIENKKPLYNYRNDARIDAIEKLITENPTKKFLLICRTAEKVMAINNELTRRNNYKISLFYEEMDIIERDKSAAWFSIKEGAQLLISSEIGSEGRNFQFAHGLILFDLPLNPEVLEQRIGRLDRIGRKQEVNLYILYLENSCDEFIYKWHSYSLDAFEQSVEDASIMNELSQDKLREMIIDNSFNNKEKVQEFLDNSLSLHIKHKKIIEGGRDTLLEINSYNPTKTKDLLSTIQNLDNDNKLENFMLEVFDYYGLDAQSIGYRKYVLKPDHVRTDAFPVLDSHGTTATFDRETALKSENFMFLTIDHPLVKRSIELVTGSEEGSVSTAVWYDEEATDVYLECVFILESIAPEQLFVDRFLPPKPIRVMVNTRLKDCSELLIDIEKKLIWDIQSSDELLNNSKLLDKFIEPMINAGKGFIDNDIQDIKNKAIKIMSRQHIQEIERLEFIEKNQESVNRLEIDELKKEMLEISDYIEKAESRLDALRIIWRKSRFE